MKWLENLLSMQVEEAVSYGATTFYEFIQVHRKIHEETIEELN